MLDEDKSYQKYGFEKLEVYKLAEDLIVAVYKITNRLPQSELFGLSSQIKRAVISIALNLAEGSVERSSKDFVRFINIAIGSLIETKAGLRIGVKLNLTEQKDFKEILPSLDELFFKMLALKKSLKNASNI